jgi:hypothetical protein
MGKGVINPNMQLFYEDKFASSADVSAK